MPSICNVKINETHRQYSQLLGNISENLDSGLQNSRIFFLAQNSQAISDLFWSQKKCLASYLLNYLLYSDYKTIDFEVDLMKMFMDH